MEGKGASPCGRVLNCIGAPQGEKAVKGYTLPEYIENAPEKCRRNFLKVYLSNRSVFGRGERGFRISLERRGEFKALAKQFLTKINELVEDVTGADGMVYTGGDQAGLYFRFREAKKVFEAIDLRYNEEKGEIVEEKF
ncbi:hypothetical protein AKJ66_00050 [candidate division MSBL1 archaeon SCGC-AAA259E22]|uniref:Uncharacterized protein n=1 Tax=candidate division MSBL1 archaeon SCGC-AAA259E22 TaxID=1698265 RepID=A0A133UIE2_9EURY|nr:hypothetical protein AKJ66_00050 [candidate division MSBL1 archaeon SCGC-AAA259E22]